MTNGQHDIDELRQTLERRIRRLQIQKAEYGLQVPPYVLEDLEQAERDLAGLTVVASPRISSEVVQAVPPNEREHATLTAILSLNADVAELKRELRDDRARDAEDRERRRLETDQYRSFVEQHVRRLWMSMAANATATALAWLVGRRTMLVHGASPLPPLWRWLLSAYVFVGAAIVWHLRTRWGLWRDA
jgi:hypothetical protein